jgi:peptidoglycan hydrolase-like protein with peptidoglycan-binding domain
MVLDKVRASLTGATPVSATPAASAGKYSFARDLKLGSTGEDVKNLQKVLNMSADTLVAVSGAGSPGSETTNFGPATKAAVLKFQLKYGVVKKATETGAGRFGPGTRAKVKEIYGSR